MLDVILEYDAESVDMKNNLTRKIFRFFGRKPESRKKQSGQGIVDPGNDSPKNSKGNALSIKNNGRIDADKKSVSWILGKITEASIAVIVSIFVSVIANIILINNTSNNISHGAATGSDRADNTDTRLNNMDERLNGLDGKLDFLAKNIDGKFEEFGNLLNGIINNEKISASSYHVKTAALLSEPLYEYNDTENMYLLVQPSWDTSNMIAMNAVGEEYSAGELIDEPILFTYNEDGKDVVILGQFNDNHQWHGVCIINIYEKGNLHFIMEATYNNGVLQNYKQVFKDTTVREGNIWVIASRVNEGDYNSGETWQFIRENEYIMDFDINDADASDVLDVDTFKLSLDNLLAGYYNGNTSNGKYNDVTGLAYLVKYFEDGTVRTLYIGMFRNGVFDDETGSAWYITKEENTNYMYYKGYFKNGNTQNNEGYIYDNDLSLEKIKDLLRGYYFKYDFTWSG